MSRADFRVDSEVDVLAILGVLVAHEVDFVVIGGVAVARHGFVRATKEVDIVPAPEPENLEKLFAALTDLRAEPRRLRDFRREELVDLAPDNLALGGNWDLATRYGRLDVMQYIAGAIEAAEDYRRLRSEALASDLGFGTVFFAGYDELLDLKQLAGREVDLVDIRALREARGETRAGLEVRLHARHHR